MPELPEVEGARRLLERTAVGQQIVMAVVADDDKVIQGVTPDELRQALEGRTIVSAKRLGKHLWLELSNVSHKCPALLLHFGMTGGLVVKGVGSAHYKSFSIDATNWPPRFCKIELGLSDGTQLAFCDSRRFARVRLLEDPESQPPLSELGWDPLLSWPSLEDFTAALAKQRRALKAVLLDQSFSAGVGNWVADEVLYQARIHPEQPANSLMPEQAKSLHALTVEVCRTASEVEADAERLPKDWLFHVRWGKGSKEVAKIGGHTIQHITVGGRTSAFVPALQKLSKAAAPKKTKAEEKGAAKKSRKKKGHEAAAADGGAAAAAADGEGDASEAAPAANSSAPAASKARGRAGGRKAKAAAAGGEGAVPAAAKAKTKAGSGRRRAPAGSKAATAVAVVEEVAVAMAAGAGEPAAAPALAPGTAKGRGRKGPQQGAVAGAVGTKRGRSGSGAAATGEEGGAGSGSFRNKRAKS